jgi:hypothetical protein
MPEDLTASDRATPPDEPNGDGPPPPAWTRLVAPLRSEAAAFRMVLVVAAVFVAFAAVVLLVRGLT